ncbi:unnamed protein product, partial [Coregonus sp. 'balchen']
LTISEEVPLEQRYEARVFENDGALIHEEVQKIGSLEKLDAKDFPVSDDTVMHLATAEALVKVGKGEGESFLKCVMSCCHNVNRTPNSVNSSGNVSARWSTAHLNKHASPALTALPGTYGELRGALRFPSTRGVEGEHLLIAVSVESGHLNHHHPTGPIRHIPMRLSPYLEKRVILNGKSKPQFPERYGVKEREVHFQGMCGTSGHDAPMIAYDALLKAGDSRVELANHGFFYGGDSDSTSAIAVAWLGAPFSFRGVPEINYHRLEYRDRRARLGQQLYELRRNPLGAERE